MQPKKGELILVQTLDVISINIWHIIISLLNLVILFLILKKLLFKPVKKIFAERQAQVDTIYSKANEANEQAQANKKEYEERLSHSKEEATNILRTARELAEQSSNEILQEAHNKADLAVQKANAEIANDRKKAINEIKNEISEISIDIAEQVVGREINEKDHSDLINNFIENIGE